MKKISEVLSCCLLLVCFQLQAENVDQLQQLNQGLQLIEQQNFSEAETIFATLSEQFPQQISYRNNLAVVQMAQGKTDQALNNLNSIMLADKFYSIAQKNISDIYAFMASQAYAKALDKKDQAAPPVLSTITDLMPDITNEPEATTETIETNIDQPSLIDDEKQLKNKTESWASAWMQGDFKQYLSNYSEQFIPSDGLAYSDWQSQRRYRLKHSKQVKVSYNQWKVFFGSQQNTAIVEFIQQYSAGNYQDTVKKQLYWRRFADDWKIVREQVTEKI